MFGLIEWLMMPFVFAFTAIFFVFWLWMLIHAVTNTGMSDTEKVMWVVLIVFTNLIGAAIYFFIGRPKHRRGAV